MTINSLVEFIMALPCGKIARMAERAVCLVTGVQPRLQEYTVVAVSSCEPGLFNQPKYTRAAGKTLAASSIFSLLASFPAEAGIVSGSVQQHAADGSSSACWTVKTSSDLLLWIVTGVDGERMCTLARQRYGKQQSTGLATPATPAYGRLVRGDPERAPMYFYGRQKKRRPQRFRAGT